MSLTDVDQEDRIVLRPRKSRLILLMLVSLIFGAGGFWMLGDADRFYRWVGAGIIGLFGLGFVGFGICLLPGCSFLELSSETMTLCTFYRRQSYRWEAIGHFGVVEMHHSRYVAFDLLGDAPQVGVRSFNRNAFGFEAMLPDTFGMRAEDLAELLVHWKQKSQDPCIFEDYDDLDDPVD